MKYLYIPENLDLKSIVPPELNKPIHLDYLHYIINIIYERRILYKEKTEYIPLKADYLRKIISRYKKYRDFLINQEILGCDNFYVKKEKSYGFKLLPPYSDTKHKKVNIESYVLRRKLEQWKRKRLPKTKVHKKLYDFLSQIEIDYSKAEEEISKFSIKSYNSSKIAIDKFLHKEFHLYNDEYGRVHTNITSLKSCLRKHLLFKGKKLVNIDIYNSQPLLIIPSLYPSHGEHLSVSANSDYNLYVYLVEQGLLYDFLMKQTGIDDRNTMKEMVFKECFYGKKVSNFFKDLFPSLTARLEEVKKGNYKRLAWLMQKAESKLIITKVCGRIIKQNPETFISTIHDSILTIPEHVDMIKTIILEEFGRLNLKPKIRVEYY